MSYYQRYRTILFTGKNFHSLLGLRIHAAKSYFGHQSLFLRSFAGLTFSGQAFSLEDSGQGLPQSWPLASIRGGNGRLVDLGCLGKKPNSTCLDLSRKNFSSYCQNIA